MMSSRISSEVYLLSRKLMYVSLSFYQSTNVISIISYTHSSEIYITQELVMALFLTYISYENTICLVFSF